MTEKIKLYDDSKCTACRGCQLACKQWNELKARQTQQQGTYQNPPSLQTNTYMLIHFQDYVSPEGDIKWLFRKEACMHCTDAACVTVCPSGALYYNKEMGTVGLDREKCIGCKECLTACPFLVPRYDSKSAKVFKCDMCESRIVNNLEPACVKACPTGALAWGEKDKILEIAHKRAEELGGNATTYGDEFVGGTHFMYVLKEKPEIYAEINKKPRVPLSVVLWKSWLKPLSLLAAGGALGGSILHYILHGPKRPDPEQGTDVKTEGGE
ncbi:MAG TPA: 4Fe-4S dicluster domain-containing protein [Deltaproteobacteria bacterium]|nr:4Fe-4S dicluster domain-containing protein [Deltaproteobacteria bacterium]